jgi:GPI mannosyltransferase 3
VLQSQNQADTEQEWRNQLRSSLHPVLFALVYHAASIVSSIVDLSPPLRAELLVAAPKVIQGVLAGLLDFYTWKLADKLYDRNSSDSWATVGALALITHSYHSLTYNAFFSYS